jgi:hypothetical protein
VSNKHIPTVMGVLLIRNIQGQLYILIQKRIRNKNNPTNGKWGPFSTFLGFSHLLNL